MIVAETSGLTITFATVYGVAQLITTIWLYIVSTKTKKVDTLEANQAKMTQDLVDQKFSTAAAQMQTQFERLAAEIRVSLASVTAGMKHIEQRLERGDQQFDRDGDSLRKVELAMVAKIAELRVWVTENCATKEDLAALSENLQQLAVGLAKFESAGR